MIPRNEIRQVIVPLSYSDSDMIVCITKEGSTYHSKEWIKSLLYNEYGQKFIVRGQFKNHPYTKPLKLTNFSIHHVAPQFVGTGTRSHDYFVICDIVTNDDRRPENKISYFVNVFLQLDPLIIEKYLESDNLDVVKRLRRSPNITKEQKVYLKLKHH